MRLFIGVCALAITAGAASAQATDTLHLSRRQTIAEALVKNAQLEVAREQTAQARARRVTSIAIPDPTLTAAFDQEPSPFSLSGAASRPVGLGLTIPFPDKFRLNNRIGVADIRNSESNYRLQQQTVAVQASATYDSLLVALEHRKILKEAETTAKDFLNRRRPATRVGRPRSSTSFRRRSASRRPATISSRTSAISPPRRLPSTERSGASPARRSCRRTPSRRRRRCQIRRRSSRRRSRTAPSSRCCSTNKRARARAPAW